jgi:hypothetical protein
MSLASNQELLILCILLFGLPFGPEDGLVSSSEMLDSYWTTQPYIPKYGGIHAYLYENGEPVLHSYFVSKIFLRVLHILSRQTYGTELCVLCVEQDLPYDHFAFHRI